MSLQTSTVTVMIDDDMFRKSVQSGNLRCKYEWILQQWN